jgi:hypothetical protein
LSKWLVVIGQWLTQICVGLRFICTGYRSFERGIWTVQNVQFVQGHWTSVQSVHHVHPVQSVGELYAWIRSITPYNARLSNRTVCTVCTVRRNLFSFMRMRVARVIKGKTVQTVQTQQPP